MVVLLLATGTGSAACDNDRSTATPLPIDLARTLSGADRLPAGDPDVVRADLVEWQADLRPAVVLSTPARVTWSVQMVERAVLATDAAVRGPAADGSSNFLLFGVSDERRYDDLGRYDLVVPAEGPPTWLSLRIDLSEYSGRKWSLFYQPDRRRWNLIINTRGTPGVEVVLVEPRVIPAE